MSSDLTFKLAVAGATVAGVVAGYYLLFSSYQDEMEEDFETDERIRKAEMRRRAYRTQVINLTFRSLKAIALADGELHEKERALLHHCADVLTVKCPNIDELQPITPHELACSIIGDEPDKQAYLLTLMVHLALIDGDEHPAEFALVQKFADGFGVDPSVLANLRKSVGKGLEDRTPVIEAKHPQLSRRSSNGSSALILGSTDFCSALTSLCHR
eukprot:CAMPEP_0115865588 /NCGR_PEP_ID=MMETSP0287-20121206/19800_1 /TAXON_ID=412157 /ORGANISM="Chrysochromulina rotalis, Strain UIO044" /LENGTH=213 /DNA_ID=CAMNT_0003320107 /DNA_START=57 /DNA_END=698 /DNA_ORIENTATION=+